MNYLDEIFLMLPDPALKAIIRQFFLEKMLLPRREIEEVLYNFQRGENPDQQEISLRKIRTNLSASGLVMTITELNQVLKRSIAVAPALVGVRFRSSEKYIDIQALTIIEPEIEQISFEKETVPGLTIAQSTLIGRSSRELDRGREELFAQLKAQSIEFSSIEKTTFDANLELVIRNL